MSLPDTDSHPVVSAADWLAARKELLAKEKAHMRSGDQLASDRRALPWMAVEKPYVFDTSDGPKTLAELFDGRDQLIVHHLMYHPDWEEACVGCSFQADHIDGPARHLYWNGVAILAVSRAPIEKLAAYKQRMGWSFPWVSSINNSFNFDFGVSFSEQQVASGRIEYNFGTIEVDPRYLSEELPGVSVFVKDGAGRIFRTYSTYARGLDALLDAHHYLDLTPGGRTALDTAGALKRHDRYGLADDAA